LALLIVSTVSTDTDLGHETACGWQSSPYGTHWN